MTRPAREVDSVLDLAKAGLNSCAIARQTGIPRSTIVNWRHGRHPPLDGPGDPGTAACIRCSGYRQHPFPATTDCAYAYLLAMYLGDGCVLEHRRKVYRLNIALDARHPLIAEETAAAVALVMPPNKVSIRSHRRDRCVEVNAYSRHWPCLLPQHGRGRKHERRIELSGWQRDIVDRNPWRFLRGLIQSDGSRFLNTVRHPKKTYSYPRYNFTNRSQDIRDLFCEYCDLVGVEWRQMNRWNISVARRDSVALLDRYIGHKR